MTEGRQPGMAGAGAGIGRLGLKYRGLSLTSQQSNSVPSTPSQQPRDIHFPSRSPSPNRGLNNHSPRSVVSEQVGQAVAQRSTPVVCKFETGAEIRKRRIPYVEGGHEELGPPKKEPKRAMEPDEHSKLSADMRELYDWLLPSDESEKRRAQLVQKLDRILNDEWPGSDIRVNVFGSSGNLLSSSDSDVDICITTPLKKLESMHSIATLLHTHGMEKVVCRASAKVPIVKCWDPELRLAVDLNVNNPLALENTRMIKTYVQLDDRVRPLAKIIKYWTKRRILNDAAFGGTISSYTWICMILSFLQRRDPPIIPSLQKMEDNRRTCDNGEKSQFADDLDALKGYGDANKETLAELLFHFFREYGYEFEYARNVVSVKEGRLLSRKEKGWDPSNYQDKEARNRLCVEEPFTVIRNLGNSADDYAWSGIHGEIRRAFELLADGAQLDKCCEQYEFPPEEKPIFQKPVPKPKPTLTRSASQSGRTNQEPGQNRSRKGGNRNPSTQRPGSRRASSGASFSNQRVPVGGFASPPVTSMMDYFAQKGDLHNQLFQQYQYLQAQQDALRNQLQQQQHQSSAHGRQHDNSNSPHHRSFANGQPSPRFPENPPQTAPLMPGYPYHYPQKYPPPSPMSQARSREGTNTNPSSPSLVAAVPALRRQVHRASVGDQQSASTRSQSQPGRSLPHPLTMQQQGHPGYDASGVLGAQFQNFRPTQGYPQMQQGLQVPFSPLTAMSHPATGQAMENAMPKEYLGYYVGQSPSLQPQYANAGTGQMQVSQMTLRDPPTQRPRRVTPEMPQPVQNGRRGSKSPPSEQHLRSYATTGDLRTKQRNMMRTSPTACEQPAPLPPKPPAPVIEAGGPLIVNGSTPAPAQHSPDVMNGAYDPTHVAFSDPWSTFRAGEVSTEQALPMRNKLNTSLPPSSTSEHPEKSSSSPSPRISPSPRFRTGPKLALSPNGAPQDDNGNTDFHSHHEASAIPGPLLSPVAELRTPSPTRPNAFAEKDSPQANGLPKAAKIANAKQFESQHEPFTVSSTPKHERKSSAPNPSNDPKPKKSNSNLKQTAAGSGTNVNGAHSQWQQATRKGHKKSKSSLGVAKGNGQPMPANESERKGG